MRSYEECHLQYRSIPLKDYIKTCVCRGVSQCLVFCSVFLFVCLFVFHVEVDEK